MRVTVWGSRGSLASPGPDTAEYGGNTCCVELLGREGTRLILDAGSGLRRLGMATDPSRGPIHILLTHLHMDHIQGLGFFDPLYNPESEVHIWGPASPTASLDVRLSRYLSPPYFPLHFKEFPTRLHLHELTFEPFEIGEFRVFSQLICHPGPTAGFRIAAPEGVLAYLPDHEPALGVEEFPLSRDWTSGYELAAGADLLIHDAQYSPGEYCTRAGWGHSTLPHTFAFAELAGAKNLMPFHHDPAHSDADLDRLLAKTVAAVKPNFQVTPGKEGLTMELSLRKADLAAGEQGRSSRGDDL